MLKLNSELRAEARASLKGKWFIAAVTVLIYVAIVFTFSFIPFLSAPLSLFVGTVLGYGLVVAFLDSFRGKELEIGDLFEGFKNYGKVLGTTLLTTLYIFLWMLLLIIPGIIKSYSYAMTPYLLRDNPELGADELICKSMEMMKGHKKKLFLLDLSFIGWGLLCIYTLGSGFLWLAPYISSSHAAFYEDLRAEQISSALE